MSDQRRGRLSSVNTGVPEALVDDQGRQWTTAIRKRPVQGRVLVRRTNLAGDDQADRRVHGGPDKAVYAYGASDVAWWAAGLERDLAPGAFGENLTVEGFDVSAAVVGERWHIGGVTLEVCQPRLPCKKLGVAMGDMHFPREFVDAARPGAYLRVVEEGELGAGDAVQVGQVPDHGLTVAEVFRGYHQRDPGIPERMLAAPALAQSWLDWAEERRSG